MVTRIRQAAGNTFQIRLQNPSDASLSSYNGYKAHYWVIEEGVYTLANDGIKMEARKLTSKTQSRYNNYFLESRGYKNTYTNPVVVGQVMSDYNERWSVFWASGDSSHEAPDASYLNASKFINQDTITARRNEVLGVVVMEKGKWNWDIYRLIADQPDVPVQAMLSKPDGTEYNFEGIIDIQSAQVSNAGFSNLEQVWPILVKSSGFMDEAILMGLDEDQIGDAERLHLDEMVGLVIAGVRDSTPPATPTNLWVNRTSTGATFGWDIPNNEEDLVLYKIFQNGTPIDSTYDFSYLLGGIHPDSTYTLTILRGGSCRESFWGRNGQHLYLSVWGLYDQDGKWNYR